MFQDAKHQLDDILPLRLNSDLVESLLDRLPKIPSITVREQLHVRPEVVEMLTNYVTGRAFFTLIQSVSNEWGL